LSSPQVVWYSDFEKGTATSSVPNPWTGFGDSGGSIQRVNTDLRVFEGSFACQITAPAGTNKAYGMRRLIGGLPAGRYGLECWVSSPSLYANYLDFRMVYLDPVPAFYYEAVLRWDVKNNNWRYMDSTGAFPVISGSTFMPNMNFGELFDHFKLVFDFSTGKYARVIADYLELDLDPLNLAMFKTSNATSGRFLSVGITLVNGRADPLSVWIDNVTLTRNEA